MARPADQMIDLRHKLNGYSADYVPMSFAEGPLISCESRGLTDLLKFLSSVFEFPVYVFYLPSLPPVTNHLPQTVSARHGQPNLNHNFIAA